MTDTASCGLKLFNSYMIFKMMDKDESGCVDHHEYFDILDVIQ